MFALVLLLTTVTPTHAKIHTVTGLADEAKLAAVATQYGIPPIIMWAIAFKESGVHGTNHVLGPGYLFQPLEIISIDTTIRDTKITIDTVYKRYCREIGRMQINPCDKDRHWRPNQWARLSRFCKWPMYRDSYNANIRCGAAILRYRSRKYHYDYNLVVLHWNGNGDQAVKYVNSFDNVLGQFVLKLLRHRSQNSKVWLTAMGSLADSAKMIGLAAINDE